MPLTTKQKYEIVILKEQGYTAQKISQIMNINIKSVYRWLQRYQIDENLGRKIGSGRPKITTVEQDQKLFDELKENKHLNADKLKKNWKLTTYMLVKIPSLID